MLLQTNTTLPEYPGMGALLEAAELQDLLLKGLLNSLTH
jgi:hypothetical protein